MQNQLYVEDERLYNLPNSTYNYLTQIMDTLNKLELKCGIYIDELQFMSSDGADLRLYQGKKGYYLNFNK